MEYIVLGIAILILAVMAWRGYTAGLIKMAIYVVALVLSIAITGILLKPASDFIKQHTQIYEGVESSVRDIVDDTDIYNTEQLKELPFPEYILDQTENAINNGGDEVTEIIVGTVSKQIYGAIVYVGLNVIVYFAIRFILGAAGVISMLPVVKELNKLSGFLIGLAEGIIVLWIICMVLQACAGETWAQTAFSQIEENPFLSWIYNNNLIEKTISKNI